MPVDAPARPGTYTTTEALALSGVTYRRLDYWCRVGVFDTIERFEPTPGSGISRQWSSGHVQALTVCGRLAEAFAEEGQAETARALPTVLLARAVAALVRHNFPTTGALMVNAEDALWSDDPTAILSSVLDGRPHLVATLRASDRPE